MIVVNLLPSVLDDQDPTAPADRPTPPPVAARARRPGCLRAGGIAVLLVLCGVDAFVVGTRDVVFPPQLLVDAVGLTALLWPVARRPGWLTPQVRTGVPAALTLAHVLVHTAFMPMSAVPPGQLLWQLCLLPAAVRNCPPRWALYCGVLNGIAVLALPLPYYVADHDSSLEGVEAGLLVVIGCTAGFGAYLRERDRRRAEAVTETRRAERLAMATDLHDFVAHHVTGILVQAQMARMLAATGPDRLDPVLAGIEHAATEALASMRRTVGVLRDHEEPEESARRRPLGDLAALADLVHGFDGVGGADRRTALLHRDPSVPDDLPHEVQTAAFRVAQEALTNVRRHAADATEVTVALRYGDGNLEVAVRDDDRGTAPLPEAARGGGFGLVGLTERVTALGGHLGARRRTEGPGWEVVAVLPARGGGGAPKRGRG
ncbi:integral membrane sensor signal transduction histidine kinase [Actinobacteria bacterium OK074]|nr:integral membrane sensor signal transduction histidine kinase [Actinobacteria bacterium OK074]